MSKLHFSSQIRKQQKVCQKRQMVDYQYFIIFGDFKKMLYLCTRNWETPKSV